MSELSDAIDIANDYVNECSDQEPSQTTIQAIRSVIAVARYADLQATSAATKAAGPVPDPATSHQTGRPEPIAKMMLGGMSLIEKAIVSGESCNPWQRLAKIALVVGNMRNRLETNER
jgi:hypothetical protein